MGGSQSKITQVDNKTIVNRTQIDTLNETINQTITNTLMKSASECGSSISQSQTIDVSGGTTKGDVVLEDVTQKQTATLNFSCIIKTEINNKIADNMSTEYLNILKQNFTADVLTKMDTTAKTVADTGFGATSDSKTNVFNFSNMNNINETYQNIRNVVNNTIENNFKTDILSTCQSYVNNSQVISVANRDVDGNIKIGNITQEQVADVIIKAVLETKITNDTTTALITKLGVTVDETSTTKNQTDLKTDVTTENTSSGLDDVIMWIAIGLCILLVLAFFVKFVLLKKTSQP